MVRIQRRFSQHDRPGHTHSWAVTAWDTEVGRRNTIYCHTDSASRGRSTNAIGGLAPHLLVHLGYQPLHLRNKWPKPQTASSSVTSSHKALCPAIQWCCKRCPFAWAAGWNPLVPQTTASLWACLVRHQFLGLQGLTNGCFRKMAATCVHPLQRTWCGYLPFAESCSSWGSGKRAMMSISTEISSILWWPWASLQRYRLDWPYGWGTCWNARRSPFSRRSSCRKALLLTKTVSWCSTLMLGTRFGASTLWSGTMEIQPTQCVAVAGCGAFATTVSMRGLACCRGSVCVDLDSSLLLPWGSFPCWSFAT